MRHASHNLAYTHTLVALPHARAHARACALVTGAGFIPSTCQKTPPNAFWIARQLRPGFCGVLGLFVVVVVVVVVVVIVVVVDVVVVVNVVVAVVVVTVFVVVVAVVQTLGSLAFSARTALFSLSLLFSDRSCSTSLALCARTRPERAHTVSSRAWSVAARDFASDPPPPAPPSPPHMHLAAFTAHGWALAVA